MNLNSFTKKTCDPQYIPPPLCTCFMFFKKKKKGRITSNKNELSSKYRSLHLTSAYRLASGSSFAGSILMVVRTCGRRGQCSRTDADTESQQSPTSPPVPCWQLDLALGPLAPCSPPCRPTARYFPPLQEPDPGSSRNRRPSHLADPRPSPLTPTDP